MLKCTFVCRVMILHQGGNNENKSSVYSVVHSLVVGLEGFKKLIPIWGKLSNNPIKGKLSNLPAVCLM